MRRKEIEKPAHRSGWLGVVALLLLLLIALCACSSGVYHRVKPGQNLYRISKTYGVSETYLARINGITDPTLLQTGTLLFIPGAQRALKVPVITGDVSPPPPPPAKPPTQKPFKQAPSKVKSKPAMITPATPEPAATSIRRLHWPLRGKIVHSFSATAKAGGGKGIEIAVRSGSEVSAAEAGKVIYSGDGVKGYGHLIILQHENDLFTVYGFNQKNLVKMGDFVSRGEKIAYSGVPPAGGEPRLHFEVRKGKQAVNPILYLP